LVWPGRGLSAISCTADGGAGAIYSLGPALTKSVKGHGLDLLVVASGRFRIAMNGLSRFLLGQHAADDLAVDVGKSVLPALVAECETRVIDATKVHDGGLHVVDVHGIGGNIPSKLVGGSVNVPAFDATAS
jgi:hypothetical protein